MTYPDDNPVEPIDPPDNTEEKPTTTDAQPIDPPDNT